MLGLGTNQEKLKPSPYQTKVSFWSFDFLLEQNLTLFKGK